MKVKRCAKGKFCKSLCDVMTAYNRKGINGVLVCDFDTGKVEVLGVAFKGTERSQGIFFNFCPFCGGDIAPVKMEPKP